MSVERAWAGLLFGFATVLIVGFVEVVQANPPNTLSEEEKKASFVLLFNGRDLDGWKPADGDTQIEDGPWKVQDGAIFLPQADSTSLPALLHWRTIIPADFDLRFEWKEKPLSPQPFEGQFSISTIGVKTETGWMGYLECAYNAGERFINLTSNGIILPIQFNNRSSSQAPGKDARRPIGQWNEARMVCKGLVFQHWLNGEKILEIDVRKGHWLQLDNVPGNPLLDEWEKVKPKGFRLAIDVLGDAAWYRSFKVRAIPQDEEIVARQDNKDLGPAEESK
jgi:hypothetical protein